MDVITDGMKLVRTFLNVFIYVPSYDNSIFYYYFQVFQSVCKHHLKFCWISLVVQWLRLHAANVREHGFDPWLGN